MQTMALLEHNVVKKKTTTKLGLLIPTGHFSCWQSSDWQWHFKTRQAIYSDPTPLNDIEEHNAIDKDCIELGSKFCFCTRIPVLHAACT